MCPAAALLLSIDMLPLLTCAHKGNAEMQQRDASSKDLVVLMGVTSSTGLNKK
jgi:hypothetical protein